jgi:hypothetical protein
MLEEGNDEEVQKKVLELHSYGFGLNFLFADERSGWRFTESGGN